METRIIAEIQKLVRYFQTIAGKMNLKIKQIWYLESLWKTASIRIWHSLAWDFVSLGCEVHETQYLDFGRSFQCFTFELMKNPVWTTFLYSSHWKSNCAKQYMHFKLCSGVATSYEEPLQQSLQFFSATPD
jgi:hypothetical protein